MATDFPTRFDVIVVGGGHAGTEAALAAARRGANTLLLTHNLDTLGAMSCNPAIGGIGKSHLVKEIDALGGAMAKAADQSGIQVRVLNARKGPAVRATRIQTDRSLYRAAIRKLLENQERLWLFQQAVDDLIIGAGATHDQVQGVVTQLGIRFFAANVVLTVGTFLGGRIHVGLDHHRGGRAGDPPAIALADRLRELPFKVARLKTGTPPRIDARSVNVDVLTAQHGDTPTPTMSYLGPPADRPQQVCCYLTHTNATTHRIISDALDRSPLFTGACTGAGPRYCPSIEDKITRFADKETHQLFLEPEGLNTHELYPNGISTSLPFDAQLALVQSIHGLENAHITRPGYAIEYDYFDPRHLQHSLETRVIGGLFFAGQINGTTGYEEAAAQGLLAGLNAALRAQEQDRWYPRRDEAYLGVLIDDLITHGTNEPYRMFTSRAEYRLLLREDNADLRLTEQGRTLGLVDDHRWALFCDKRERITRETQRLKTHFIHPNTTAAKALAPKLAKPLSHEHSLLALLSRPELTYADIAEFIDEPESNPQVTEQIAIQTKYQGYIDRQAHDIQRLRHYENTVIPTTMDYDRMTGLSNEVRQKLTEHRPTTLGQAARIAGITPAALSLLLIHLKAHSAR